MERISVDSTTKLAPLRHPWKQCITVGRGFELLRADLQEHLRFLRRELGYEHIRFHGSFHDDVNVVQRRADGGIEYRWTQLDHIYDFLVDAGFDPIVEINPMPSALASGEKTMFWYKMNVTPPASYTEWEGFIGAYIAHTVERYGIDRVRRWYFEVWNEPDLRDSFWTGSMEDYYRLYASCARILKGFDKNLRVGGPATAGALASVLPFAQWCRSNKVPMDFLSYHAYPQNEATRYSSTDESPSAPGMHFIDTVVETQATLREEGFSDLPLLMTEWNTQSQEPDFKARWVGNEHVNDLFAGAAVCHLAYGCDDALDMMGYWVASDVFEEGGPQLEPYGSRYQYYGMLTINGVPKSSYHAFSFLNRLQGERFALQLPAGSPPTRGAVVTDERVATRALVWNCSFPTGPVEPWTLEIDLPVPRLVTQMWDGRPGDSISATRTASTTEGDPAELRLTCGIVRAGQGSAYEYWKAMGTPATLTRIEQEVLAARAVPDWTSQMAHIVDGKARVQLRLGPNEFALLELGGAPAGPANRSGDATPDASTSVGLADESLDRLNADLMT